MVNMNYLTCQDHEIPNGWPLGLEVMNSRLRVFDSLPVATVQRYTLHAPSASISSFLSSDLDTEVTRTKFYPVSALFHFSPRERHSHPSIFLLGHKCLILCHTNLNLVHKHSNYGEIRTCFYVILHHRLHH